MCLLFLFATSTDKNECKSLNLLVEWLNKRINIQIWSHKSITHLFIYFYNNNMNGGLIRRGDELAKETFFVCLSVWTAKRRRLARVQEIKTRSVIGEKLTSQRKEARWEREIRRECRRSRDRIGWERDRKVKEWIFEEKQRNSEEKLERNEENMRKKGIHREKNKWGESQWDLWWEGEGRRFRERK